MRIEYIRNWIFLGFVLFFVGCAGQPTSSKPVTSAKSNHRLLLSPESFGGELTLTQVVVMSFREESRELLLQIEITKEQLVLVGMTPQGAKLFTLTHRQGQVEVEGITEVTGRIKPYYLLADLQFVLWPLEVLQEALQTQEILIRQKGVMRTLTNRERVELSAQYTGHPGPCVDVLLRHLDRQYWVKITHLDNEPG